MMTRVIGAYELGAPFGALGCGMAMHAVHVVSRQPRTVVILSPQLLADPAAPEAFRRRAQQTAGRREDGVADLVDVGTEGSITYAVVEALSGQTLRDRLRAGDGPGPDLSLSLLEQLAAVLDLADARGDRRVAISPRNLVLDANDRLIVADLGLAQILDATARQLLFDAEYEAVARISDGRLSDLHGIGLLARELFSDEAVVRELGRLDRLQTVLDRHLDDPGRPTHRSARALISALRTALDRAEGPPRRLPATPVSLTPPHSWPPVQHSTPGATPLGSARVPGSTPPSGATPSSGTTPVLGGTTVRSGAAASLAQAFMALAAGRFDMATQHLAAAQAAQTADRATVGNVADAADSITTISGLARDLSERLRSGRASSGLRQFTRGIGVALAAPAVPAHVRDLLEPVVAAWDEALARGQQTPALVRLGQRPPAGEQNEWRDLTYRLLQALPRTGSAWPATAAATASTALALAAPEAGTVGRRQRSQRVAVLAGGLLLIGAIVAGVAYVMLHRSSAVTATTPSTIAGTPRALTAPPPDVADRAERDADDVISQAKKLVGGDRPDADKAVAMLDDVSHRLPLDSRKRPDVDNLMIQTLLDDADRRVGVALTLKDQNGGKDSRVILTEADDRVKRAAEVRPKDAELQARAGKAHDQVELAGWWLDYTVAYHANDLDGQIAILQRLVAKSPDYATAEGPAKDKLYAAWIAKANKDWDAKNPDEATKDLDEAARVLPGHSLVGELRTKWFPPTEVPTQVAAPPTAVPVQAQPAQVAPAAKPVISAPVAPKPQIVTQPQAPAVVVPPPVVAEPAEVPAPPPAAPPAQAQPQPVPAQPVQAQPAQPPAPAQAQPAQAAPPAQAQQPAPAQPAAQPKPAAPPADAAPAVQPKPQAPAPQQQAEQRRPSIDVTIGSGAGGGGNGGNSGNGGSDSSGNGGASDSGSSGNKD